MRNNNIIRTYMIANILKNKIRTGWMEIEIGKDRLESVAEHVYGCLMLAILIDSEYDLDLDMKKVLYMLALHELEETLMPDYTVRSGITKEEKDKKGMECVFEAALGLLKQDEIVSLLNEFNERSSKEAEFCYLIDKIECDFQAKLYDLEGVFYIEKAREDLKYYGDRAEEIDIKSSCASDYWIEWDKPRYKDNSIFKDLIEDIQKIKTLKY